VRLARGVDPGGRLDVRPSLGALHRNEWIDRRWSRGTLLIRPGERMGKLLAE
jgi:hypothetical protein